MILSPEVVSRDILRADLDKRYEDMSNRLKANRVLWEQLTCNPPVSKVKVMNDHLEW